jgi:hypothetical protein
MSHLSPILMMEGNAVEQRRLFDSNVFSLIEYRQRRKTAPADTHAPRRVAAAARPVSARSIAHQARMLAHLERTASAPR